MEGEQIDAQDVAFVELTGVEVSGQGARLTLASESVLTDDGEAAFPDYQAGTEFDPVSLTLNLDQCPVYTGGYTPMTEPIPPAWVVAGAILGPLVIIAAIVSAIVLAVRRRRARA
jgi:hypothetical protein